MTAIEKVLEANQAFSLDYDAEVSSCPRLGLAVVTCMDTRLSRKSLGLSAGDAHLIRNAGGIVTDDVVRSLLISHYMLGTNEFMVVNHTDCGLMKAGERALQERIGRQVSTPESLRFYAFADPEQNVREQLQKFTALAWIERDGVVVRWFVFDVATGRLREVLR